jgi:hypothetical protein
MSSNFLPKKQIQISQPVAPIRRAITPVAAAPVIPQKRITTPAPVLNP